MDTSVLDTIASIAKTLNWSSWFTALATAVLALLTFSCN